MRARRRGRSELGDDALDVSSRAFAPRTPLSSQALVPLQFVAPTPATSAGSGTPSPFGGGSAAVGGLKYTFLCPKCKRVQQIEESVNVGSQVWCRKDKASYNQLQIRWQSQRKLKVWWQNLTDDERVSWFVKWQQD